jgi:hypothetical protein
MSCSRSEQQLLVARGNVVGDNQWLRVRKLQPGEIYDPFPLDEYIRPGFRNHSFVTLELTPAGQIDDVGDTYTDDWDERINVDKYMRGGSFKEPFTLVGLLTMGPRRTVEVCGSFYPSGSRVGLLAVCAVVNT